MTAYVDSSALLKLYIDEADSGDARVLLADGAPWVTAIVTFVEVGRVLGRVLEGRSLRDADALFQAHWQRTDVVELDERMCMSAVAFARNEGVRTLDALHLAAAERVGGGALPFLTYDVRQANAARSLGWDVRGA